jgi:hypothetical protein
MSKIQNRRDRRKAKQSDWQRPGRSNPKKVGHGGSGMRTKRKGISLRGFNLKLKPSTDTDYKILYSDSFEYKLGECECVLENNVANN